MYHLARWSAAGRRWCAGLRHSTLGWLQSRPLPGGRPWGDRLAPAVSAPAVSAPAVSAPAVSASVQWRLGVALVIFTALGALLIVRPVVELPVDIPVDLEPAPGTAQCNYELLGAFSRYMRSRGKGLRYALAAGTLLGAMRNEPPGLLQWEHDVDVYMPARDASHLLRRLQRDCAASAWYHWRSAAANLAASLTPISSRSHHDLIPISSRPHDRPQIPIASHRISILLSPNSRFP